MTYDDQQSIPDGDSSFLGVDLKTDPRRLSASMGAASINKDFSRGTAKTRGGMFSVPWALLKGVTFPVSFPCDFTLKQGFGTIYGEATISDPESGREFMLLATSCGTWVLFPNAPPKMVLFPADDEGVSDEVLIIQAFNVVLMFRGTTTATLKWDPYDDERWEYVTQTDERGVDDDNIYGDGTVPIPATDEAIAFNGRIYAKDDRDTLLAGDIFDYTRYSKTSARFRINDGDSGEIVRVWPFNEQVLIVFKLNRIHLLGNIYGALTDITNDILTVEYGCVAKRTVTTVGSDVWFLSFGGIYSVGQALENKLQANSTPISEAIEPLIRRINWNAAPQSVATYFENKFYLAVPLDSSSFNNVIIVYDYLTKAWSGYWENDFLDVRGFLRATVGGRRQLLAVMDDNQSTAANGAVMVLGNALEDDLFGDVQPVADYFLSRGYSPEQMNEKRAVSVQLGISTRQPNFQVKTILPDVGAEATQVEAQTADPLKYFEFGKADWVSDNSNADHGNPGREDYAVEMPEELAVSFPLSFPVSFFDGVYPPFNPDLAQRLQRNYRTSSRGEFVQIEITGSAGATELHHIRTDALEGSRSLRVSI